MLSFGHAELILQLEGDNLAGRMEEAIRCGLKLVFRQAIRYNKSHK